MKGYDCGDEAAKWLSKAISEAEEKEGEGGQDDGSKDKAGEEYRLLYNGDLTRARKAREPVYYSFPQYKASDRVSGLLCDIVDRKKLNFSLLLMFFPYF